MLKTEPGRETRREATRRAEKREAARPALRLVGGETAAPDAIAEAFLAEKVSPATQAAYAADLRHFARAFSGDAAAEWNVHLSARLYQMDAPGLVNVLGAYKTTLLDEGVSPATVNRRLGTVRTLIRSAFRRGVCGVDGRGLVANVPTQTLKDTRGVSVTVMKRLLALPEAKHKGADGKPTVKGLRDAAILRLFCENGFRRGEISALDVADFEPSAKRVLIRGKGRGGQREPVTLTPKSLAAVRAYLKASGHASGSLFQNVSPYPGHAGRGLTGDGILKMVTGYGAQIGLQLAPHKLRHSAITAVLHEVKGDVRQAQEFSRHKDIRTLFVYDDRRRDNQGKLSRALSRKL